MNPGGDVLKTGSALANKVSIKIGYPALVDVVFEHIHISRLKCLFQYVVGLDG